jgi:hypothetical protein
MRVVSTEIAVVDELALRPTTVSTARPTNHQLLFWYTEHDDREANLWIAASLVLDGALDRGALDRSLTTLVERHSTFRTCYRERDGALGLVVLADNEAPRFELEYAERLDQDWDAGLHQTIDELASSFDLATGRVLRARLTRVAPQRHVLVLVAHHIATDAGGFAAFTRHLSALYASECLGVPAHEAPVYQFVDYADALLQWHQTASGRAASSFWRERLRGFVPVEVPCNLPRDVVDHQRDVAPYGITASPMQQSERTTLSTEAKSTTVGLAREQGVTESVVYLAALFWLLHRQTGQTDLCIEAVSGLRSTHPELHDMQGMLSTWMFYRVDVAGCTSLRDVVQRTRSAVDETRRYPIINDYYRLVPHTVRRVVFNYVPSAAGLPALESSGLHITPRIHFSPNMKRPWDLHVSMMEMAGSTQTVWRTNTRIFTRDKMSTLLHSYLGMLGA